MGNILSNVVRVEKINEVFMRVHCDTGLSRDLYDFFSFTVPNAKFMPSFKNKMWDGKVRLFSIQTNIVYIGLLPYIDHFCDERGYVLEGVESVLGDKTSPSPKAVESFISELNLPFSPRDYQVESFLSAIEYGRKLLLSPTASGKSLIIYMLVRWFGGKSVIIVPTTSLVEQMTKDFIDYGYEEPICKIYSKQEVFDAPITVTTWQSFSKAPKNILQSFDTVIGDEAHLFKANVLKGIMEKMISTPYRVGTTGTLDGTEVHRLQLEGLFGPVKRVITTAQLMDSGTIASLKIDCLVLKHKKQPKMTYQEEIDYIVGNSERNKFICNLVYSLKGNTLVLFQYVDKHGALLHKSLSKNLDQDKLHYVYGGTDVSDRESVRTLVEASTDNVILASYGTFSTGVNIKRIDNVIFASPSKSRVRNLQSIGRGLRKSDDKTSVKLYDISDDLGRNNFTLKHFKERINIYNEEIFDYKIIQINLTGK